MIVPLIRFASAKTFISFTFFRSAVSSSSGGRSGEYPGSNNQPVVRHGRHQTIIPSDDFQ